MPVDSVRNIERAFTGRVPLITLDNDTPIGQVQTVIDYGEVLNKVRPASATNWTLSVALEQLQLICYLPGLHKAYRLPEYDEDLTPLIKQQKEDLEWMAEFNPSTQSAMEITLFEKFASSNWEPIARKWLYNQETEYYLDLINPFLNNKKQNDIGEPGYKLGIAITRKPSLMTVKSSDNYVRVRGCYSGIIAYEQTSQKVLTRNAGKQNLIVNSSSQILPYNSKRKILYFQNTGKSIVYYNFGDSISTSENCLYLLPNDSLSYEGDKVNRDLPLTEYLIAESLHIFTEGKDKEGVSTDINKVAFMEFYEV